MRPSWESPRWGPAEVGFTALVVLGIAGIVVAIVLVFLQPSTTTTVLNMDSGSAFSYPGLGNTVAVRLACFSPWKQWIGDAGSIPPDPYPTYSTAGARYAQDLAIVDSACERVIAGREHIAELVAVLSLALAVTGLLWRRRWLRESFS